MIGFISGNANNIVMLLCFMMPDTIGSGDYSSIKHSALSAKIIKGSKSHLGNLSLDGEGSPSHIVWQVETLLLLKLFQEIPIFMDFVMQNCISNNNYDVSASREKGEPDGKTRSLRK